MKLKDACKLLGGDREVIIEPHVRAVDSFGRLYVGQANKHAEGIMLMVALKDGDKGKFQK